jgi:hypothetical protein
MRAGFKLLRTSTFRLAALYLAVFALSVGALLGYVYWNTAVLLERQTDETIRAEVQALADQYRYRGLRGIIDTIQRRSKDDRGSIPGSNFRWMSSAAGGSSGMWRGPSTPS